MPVSDKYDYILRFGNHPLDWGVAETLFQATDAVPGSREKVEILKKRVALRLPLFHPNDRVDFNGMGIAHALSTENEKCSNG